jgi:glutamate-1-semialdehyde 2,1-aminomutase
VIVEPLQGSASTKVMTSRLSTGGLQRVLGVRPDLTTFGKYPGGGLAFGAFGGRSDLMSRFDLSRPGALLHAGSFDNAALTMAAGAAGLTQVYTEAEVGRLNGLGDRLRDRLNAFAADRSVRFTATGYGSMVGLHFAEGPVRRAGDIPEAPDLRALLHLHLLEQGLSYARRGFAALCLPMGEMEVEGFASATEEFLHSV